MDRRPPPRSPDRDVRELLLYLRDTFQDAASRIDAYLAAQEGGGALDRFRGNESPARPGREGGREGGREWGRRDDRGNEAPRGNEAVRGYHDAREPREGGREHPREGGRDAGVRFPLEQLREEVRWISGEARTMDPALLRLYVEAVTAETRGLQNRASDAEDQDIAAKIMRALTAIVSDHRPGHVYGLARHHQADWDDIARRARTEIKSKTQGGGAGGGGGGRGEDRTPTRGEVGGGEDQE